jgi:hypothetical protein
MKYATDIRRLGRLTILVGLALVAAACAGVPQSTERTPIPTVIPAGLAQPAAPGKLAARSAETNCPVRAVDLIGAWVQAETPETDPFPFVDLGGETCQAVFADDVLPLFDEPNLWFTGANACTSCHNLELATSDAMLDMGSHAGILAGSRRTAPDIQGNDILGGGDWEKSRLYQVLITKYMPLGRPPTSDPKGPVVLAGQRP